MGRTRGLDRWMRRGTVAGLLAAGPGFAAEIRGVVQVTDRVVELAIVDGRGVYSARGKPVDEHVEQAPLDLKAAARPVSWTVTSRADAAYRRGRHPVKVGRKSKGRDFAISTKPAWHVEWTLEHRLSLVLPEPMKPGAGYRITLGGPAGGTLAAVLRYDPGRGFSEAVRVNQLGYVPDAARKIGYVSAWLGDLGGLPLEGLATGKFRLKDAEGWNDVFEGTPRLRKRAGGEPDGGQPDEGTHFRTDVWECDFSAFRTPGDYVLAVDGVGRSYPFRIAPGVYREAHTAVMRGIFHQRCGTAREPAHSPSPRPACHRPETGPVFQSRRRYLEGHCDACQDVEATPERRDVWGGYHDAGDWDREGGHPEIPGVLAFAYRLAPGKFRDGESGIPESGNGLPDLLDEARWGLDYYRRLQRPDGGVSIGLFLAAFPQPGDGPQDDSASRYVYAEDPDASYKYAASACHVAAALALADRAADGEPYLASAVRAWTWAERNRRPGDAGKVRDQRLHAAACLFDATGERRYHEAFMGDLKIATPETPLSVWKSHDQQWAAWVYGLTARKEADPAVRDRLRRATIRYAREEYVKTAERRPHRVGYHFWRPLAWGTGAVPDTLPLAVAYALTKDVEFLWPQQTACDAALGANPLNLCWITGTGERSPEQVFHPDSWANGSGRVVAGIVPEGPHRYVGEGDPKSGPWDVKFVHATAYPHAKLWPPLELYFEARTCYPMNEFTTHQLALAAAAYGLLAED